MHLTANPVYNATDPICNATMDNFLFKIHFSLFMQEIKKRIGNYSCFGSGGTVAEL